MPQRPLIPLKKGKTGNFISEATDTKSRKYKFTHTKVRMMQKSLTFPLLFNSFSVPLQTFLRTTKEKQL